MKSPRNRRPRAPSSVLAALGTLQLGALGLLLRGDFMDSLPNLYLEVCITLPSFVTLHLLVSEIAKCIA